jgi:5-(carboxyamino)imidazole ribonucleotide mutase
MVKVGIIMGSKSDLPVMEEAARVLKEFGISCEMLVASAHRSPDKVRAFCRKAEKEMSLVIAGAGAAAHLPGVVAAQVSCPVIGVPIFTKILRGVDSFLSIVQMPSGVPVATVAINGARNAALLAVEILGVSDKNLKKRFRQYKNELAK